MVACQVHSTCTIRASRCELGVCQCRAGVPEISPELQSMIAQARAPASVAPTASHQSPSPMPSTSAPAESAKPAGEAACLLVGFDAAYHHACPAQRMRAALHAWRDVRSAHRASSGAQ